MLEIAGGIVLAFILIVTMRFWLPALGLLVLVALGLILLLFISLFLSA
jgi:hypothetical protein